MAMTVTAPRCCGAVIMAGCDDVRRADPMHASTTNGFGPADKKDKIDVAS